MLHFACAGAAAHTYGNFFCPSLRFAGGTASKLQSLPVSHALPRLGSALVSCGRQATLLQPVVFTVSDETVDCRCKFNSEANVAKKDEKSNKKFPARKSGVCDDREK